MILEGASRTEAARAEGADLQTLRDWVLRDNAQGDGGLADRPRGDREALSGPVKVWLQDEAQVGQRNGAPDNVRAGRLLGIPGEGHGFRFSAKPPAGEKMLLAVVVEPGSTLAHLASRHKGPAVVERPDAYLVELSEALRSAGGAGWRHATRHYKVVAP